MIGKNENLLDNFIYHKDQELALEGPNIEKHNIDLADKSFNIENCTRDIESRYTT